MTYHQPADQYRVAIVHDYLVHIRGGERVFLALAEIFPEADLYTLIVEPELQRLGTRRIRTTFLSFLPAKHRLYRHYLPLYMAAARTLNLDDYDVIISSSSGFAHHVRTQGLHVCYMHSPLRYAYHEEEHFVRSLPKSIQWVFRQWCAGFRHADLRAAQKVTRFVANSTLTAARIGQHFDMPATIAYPPAGLRVTSHFTGATRDGYLVVSSLLPYKKVDIAIQAFNAMPMRRLHVVGEGPELDRLRRMGNVNTVFHGRVTEDELARLYTSVRAVIVPGAEDFGLVPVEAQTYGTPVLALAAGGALESVLADVTGLFFAQDQPEAIQTAVVQFEARQWDSRSIVAHAQRFSMEMFRQTIRAVVEEALS